MNDRQFSVILWILGFGLVVWSATTPGPQHWATVTGGMCIGAAWANRRRVE